VREEDELADTETTSTSSNTNPDGDDTIVQFNTLEGKVPSGIVTRLVHSTAWPATAVTTSPVALSVNVVTLTTPSWIVKDGREEDH